MAEVLSRVGVVTVVAEVENLICHLGKLLIWQQSPQNENVSHGKEQQSLPHHDDFDRHVHSTE